VLANTAGGVTSVFKEKLVGMGTVNVTNQSRHPAVEFQARISVDAFMPHLIELLARTRSGESGRENHGIYVWALILLRKTNCGTAVAEGGNGLVLQAADEWGFGPFLIWRLYRWGQGRLRPAI